MDFESETFAVCVTGQITHALKAEGADGSEDGTGRGQPIVATMRESGQGFWMEDKVAGTLRAEGENRPSRPSNVVAFEPRCARNGRGMPEEIVPPLKAQSGMTGKGDSAPCVAAIGWSEELTASKELAGTLQYGGQGGRHDGVMTPAMQVRRLTPVECERLQGFPDGYTAIPWRNKPAEDCPDGPRYKALGNSMAVPVMRWIGGRIRKTQAG